MGYAGSYQPVRRWFFERRQLPAELIGLRMSPRHFSSLFVKDGAKLTDKEKPILSTLDTVSGLRQLRAENIRVGGSLLTAIKYEKGARLGRPSVDKVEIQPIGRGTMLPVMSL
ncbi:hypothetical protein BH24DEI2_BH24DEI2_05060 [soil metagenome]